MRYPVFYEMYRDAIRNTWTVEEVDFGTDTADLNTKMTDADRQHILAQNTVLAQQARDIQLRQAQGMIHTTLSGGGHRKYTVTLECQAT